MSDKYYSRVLMHGSKYGGFITKNGRKNNSSEYNHNYYLANILKWKKKNKDDEDDGSESERGHAHLDYSPRWKLNKIKEQMKDPKKSTAWRILDFKDPGEYSSNLKRAREYYDKSAQRLKEAKTPREKKRAKAKMILEKKAFVNIAQGARKEQMEYNKTKKGKKEQKKRNEQTKALREKHLSKGYVDMTSNRKQTAEAHYRGDKILEKNSNNLFSKTRQVKDSSGRTTTYKDVGKLERAGRDTKKKVDRLIAKYSSKKNKKKKKKSRIKVSHNTSLGIGK